jgi:alpha-ketoglutarate-dependent taurine dioxygenase
MSASALKEIERPGLSGLTVTPLQPTIGAEIGGIDISRPLSDAERDAIKAAILQYKVVFFRDQHGLTPHSHEAFAARFGPLYVHPSSRHDDKIAPIHKIEAFDAKRAEIEELRRKAAEGLVQGGYHTDTSWRLVPTWGAVLRAITLPEVGGDTIWVDAGLAYDCLKPEVKQRLQGRFVTHDFRDALNAAGHDYPIVAHPVVRKHRETGKDIVWVNFTQKPQIIGLDRAESNELLAIIHDQYRKPEYQVRFQWRPGSVAFWDNRAAVHIAVRNYGDFPRQLDRILIADEPLYADL